MVSKGYLAELYWEDLVLTSGQSTVLIGDPSAPHKEALDILKLAEEGGEDGYNEAILRIVSLIETRNFMSPKPADPLRNYHNGTTPTRDETYDCVY